MALFTDGPVSIIEDLTAQDRLYLAWGLRAVSGLQVDGVQATPESLAEAGPEELFREALAAVRAETGLSEAERKN